MSTNGPLDRGTINELVWWYQTILCPKTLFLLISESHVPIFDALEKRESLHLQILGRRFFWGVWGMGGGVTEISKICLDWEPTLHPTMNDCVFSHGKEKKVIKMCKSLIPSMFSQHPRSYYETWCPVAILMGWNAL